MGMVGQRHDPSALPRGKGSDTHCMGGWVGPRSGTHCIGGWVGPTAVLDWCGKPRPIEIQPLGSAARLSSPDPHRNTTYKIIPSSL
jgi:hypothetical protein